MCWWGNHLFVIFAVLDVSLAVNMCINCSFFTFIQCQRRPSIPMGINKFQPPTKSIPLNRSAKNSAQLITSARGSHIPNLTEIHPLWAAGQMGEYNKNCFYLFIPFFLWSAYRSDPWMDSSNDVKSRKDVPFGGMTYVPPNFGGV